MKVRDGGLSPENDGAKWAAFLNREEIDVFVDETAPFTAAILKVSKI